MPLMRNGRPLIRKVDANQRLIASGLRQAGYRVYPIEEPADLLVYGWSNAQQRFTWNILECKMPTKSGKQRKRTDQDEQTRFLEETGTPVVLTLDAALLWLQQR